MRMRFRHDRNFQMITMASDPHQYIFHCSLPIIQLITAVPTIYLQALDHYTSAILMLNNGVLF